MQRLHQRIGDAPILAGDRSAGIVRPTPLALAHRLRMLVEPALNASTMCSCSDRVILSFRAKGDVQVGLIAQLWIRVPMRSPVAAQLAVGMRAL